jgi:hypothetical protein
MTKAMRRPHGCTAFACIAEITLHCDIQIMSWEEFWFKEPRQ